MVIQQLLDEAGPTMPATTWSSVDAAGVEAPADWDTLRSPENYTGYERSENFASPGGVVRASRTATTVPAQLRLNHWALAGDWTMDEQAATLNEADGQITYRFHARDLHLVMGPAVPEPPCGSVCCSTGSRRARRTGAMSTSRATAR